LLDCGQFIVVNSLSSWDAERAASRSWIAYLLIRLDSCPWCHRRDSAWYRPGSHQPRESRIRLGLRTCFLSMGARVAHGRDFL